MPFDCGQHFPHGRLLGQWGYGRTSFFVHPSFGFDPDGDLSHLQRPHNPGIAWSKAGLRQIQRGLLEGPSGALAYFENSWDAEEDWLGAMSYAAITKIHRHLGQNDLADQNENKLNELGGWDAVDSAWNEAVDNALQSLKNSSWSKPTDDM